MNFRVTQVWNAPAVGVAMVDTALKTAYLKKNKHAK